MFHNPIPTGYKATDLGVIPEDWDVKMLPEVVNFIHGKAHEQHISVDGNYEVVNSKFVSTEGRVKKFSKVNFCPAKEGDVLTVLSDLPNGKALAKCFYADKDNKYAVNQRVCIWRTRGSNPKFLHYVLNRNKYFLALDDGVTQTHILNDHIKNCPLVIPRDTGEQKAIATALSDADDLITALDKLIAKKERIKEGAMQELLTGKRRLPGFSEEWEDSKLGDISNIQRGASPRPIADPVWFDDKSKIGWVRISDVSKSGKFLFSTVQKLSESGIKNSRPVSQGNLIMSICATVGRPVITKIDVCIHDGFVVFADLKADMNFVYYFLQFIEKDWSKEGQTGSQMNLNTTLINRTNLLLPTDQEEQKAIAQILSDMDAEIEALKQKRAKCQQIKQGMMQQLLTGKIRLV